ncbi:hypothetical protein RvY_17757-2 [Ramazzottius varieornatus]|uniref:PHD-type domain-containing protein n=1 Tax=Ramazzottius varieornatus TaxID=947166 RepID=A0A1D1W3G4_RAMVA|nr:hypothetical protein RvY_17757-2 [Ramazzottius varieornatus]
MGLKLVPIKAYTTDGKQQYILVPTNSDGASIAKHATAIAKFAQRTPGSQLLVNGPVTTPVEEQVLTVTSIEEPDSAVMPPPPDNDSGWIREHNEKLNKRMQQVKKAITTRIGVLKHGHARIKSEMVAAVLQSMVDENPELIPGLPEAPIEPVIPLSLFPQPQLVKHFSPERKSPKKSPIKKEASGIPSTIADGTPLQPEVIPTFKIKKSLLTPPPNVPEVSALKKSPEEFKSRAKMINTAPPPPEPKPSGPPKKRGRKSNAEKLAEEVAMMEAEKAEQEAMAATVTGGFLPLKDGALSLEKSKKKRNNTMMVNGELVSGKKIKLENGGEKFVPEIHDFVSPVKTEGMASIVRTATPSSEKKPSSDGKKRARMQSTSSERSPTAQRRKKVKEEEDETVLHCYCRKVYDPTRFMIECDKCERWFHGSCVHVVEGSIPKKAKWFCPDCLAGSAAAGSAVLPTPRPASGLKHHAQSDAGIALTKKKKKKDRHREEKAVSKYGRDPSKIDQRAPLPKLKIKIPPPSLAPTKTPSTEEGAPVGGDNLEKDMIPNHVLEAEESSEEGSPPDVLTSGTARNLEGVKPAEGVESPSTSTKEERSPKETDIPSISVEELERGEAEKVEKQQPRITLTLQKKKKSVEATKKNGEVISETMQEPVSSKRRKASKKGEAGKKESQGELVKKEEGSTKVKKPVMVIVPAPMAAAFKSKSGKIQKEEAPVEKKVIRKDSEAEEPAKTKGSKKGAKTGREKEAVKEVFCLCREPSKEHLVQKFIACDKCKEWFHPRCVGLTDVKAEKMAKFMCPTCSNQPQFRDFLYRKIVPPLDPAVLLSVIEDHLERSRVVDMFRNPVDLNEVPSYSAVIQEPMDLSTMKEKIQDGAYETVLDFVKDAGLIFDNAKTFNPSVRSPFYKGADTLEEVFVNRMNKLRANWN